MRTEEKITQLIKKLDTTKTSEQEEAWEQLKNLDIDIPRYFLEAYPDFKKAQGRVHLVFSCIRHVRKNESAFKLGIAALTDRATRVRYRAACILAYSLRDDAIPYLKKNLDHPDEETRKDAERAIRAIRKKNHHIFMEERAGSWIVNPETDYDKPGDKNDGSLLNRIRNIFN